MAAHPQLVRHEAKAGYMLGNHTWDHPNMTALSASAQASEMDRATTVQRNLTGMLPCAFRPPGGNYNSTTESLAQQRRMKFWTWSVDTEDWKAKGSGAFWQGTDGHLWHVFITVGAGWSAAQSLGMGTLGSTPFATAQPMGVMDVFWRGSGNDHLWHAYYRPGHGWAGPQDLGGDLYPMP